MLSLIIAGWKTKPFQKRQSKEAKTNTGTEIWSGIGNTWKKKKTHNGCNTCLLSIIVFSLDKAQEKNVFLSRVQHQSKNMVITYTIFYMILKLSIIILSDNIVFSLKSIWNWVGINHISKNRSWPLSAKYSPQAYFGTKMDIHNDFTLKNKYPIF